MASEWQKLEDRRRELLPAIAEYRRVERQQRAIETLGFQLTPPGTSVMGESRKRFSTRHRQLQAIEVLRKNPEIRRTELADALGVQISRAGKIVNPLIADGTVVEGPRGQLWVREDVGDREGHDG